MKKMIINGCWGGYHVSDEAIKEFQIEVGKYGYEDIDDVRYGSEARDNEALIAIVERLGDRASAECSCLGVVEIPDDATDFMITEYDGSETLYYVQDGKIKVAY